MSGRDWAPALTLPVAASALGVLIWILPLRLGFYRQDAITDLPTYERAADRILDGLVPYRDFALEYPPLAAGLFVVPEVLPGSYGLVFSALMLASLVATVIGVVMTARALGLTVARQAAAGGAVALSPLALGLLVETRFDMLVAALVSWTLFAAVTDRWRLVWFLVGVGVLVKLVALLLVPVLVIYQLHRHGRAAAGRGLGLAALLVAAGFLPFLMASAADTWSLISYHLERPLQIESSGSAYLLSLHALADVPLRVESSFGSQGLGGDGAQIVAALSAAILVGLVATIAVVLRWGLHRAHPTVEAHLLIAAAAATIATGLAAGKVLSPQFVMWLLPVGFIVAGRYGWTTYGLTAAVLIATAVYFPRSYWDLVELDTWPIMVLVVRDALLIALVAAAWPRPSLGRAPRSVELPSSATARRGARSLAARYLTD
ncbi:MAG: glycosyltransferase 87 family protein [Thermoleophilia bacterium]|nr:glycosyltransferase 87 family protein [Thermoleophilia bacterium]MDH3725815.1 glycosyltransferase 87 family protein [Thermoleophilia bacterium]